MSPAWTRQDPAGRVERETRETGPRAQGKQAPAPAGQVALDYGGATYLGPQPPGPQPWDPSGEERGARGRPDVPSIAGGSEELPVGLGGTGRAGLCVSVLLPSLSVTQGSTGACISGVPRGAGKGVTRST